MALRAHRRRARLSMTSLIDVIFLLLLFFMLSSTFSRFAEVELSTGGGGAGGEAVQNLLFLRLAGEALSLNGQPLEVTALRARLESAERPATALVSVTPEATAQGLTDVLVELRGLPELTVAVLESR